MLSNRKKRFFEIAEAVSNLSDYSIRVGAVIVKNGKVISVGFNKTLKRNSLRKYNGYIVRSIHAELHAILKANTDLTGAEIFVFSKKKDGEFRKSRPCNVCMSAIIEAGIKKVYYTDYGNVFVEERL